MVTTKPHAFKIMLKNQDRDDSLGKSTKFESQFSNHVGGGKEIVIQEPTPTNDDHSQDDGDKMLTYVRQSMPERESILKHEIVSYLHNEDLIPPNLQPMQ